MASFGSARGSIILDVAQAMRSVDQLSGRLRTFGNEGAATQRSFGESIIANEQHIRAVGQTMLGAGAVITGGFGLAMNSAASFEQKMNRVKALSNATGEEFELLRDRALEQGKATVFSANEAADALAFLSMAGFDVQSQYEALPGVLNLAAAAQMDLGRAADISSNILTAFGMEANQLTDVADKLTYTFTNSNTTMEDLGEAFKYVGPVAMAAGLSFDEVAASLGMLGNAGIQGSMAGTTLRGAITRLISPTAATTERLNQLGVSVVDADGKMLGLADILAQFPPVSEDSAAAMKQLGAQAEAVGVSMEDAQGNARPFEDVLADLEAAGVDTSGMLQNLGADAETVAAIMDIFGLRAGPGMLAMLSQGVDGLREFTTEIENSGGTAQRVAETQMEGFRGTLEKLMGEVETIMVTAMSAGPLQAATFVLAVLEKVAAAIGQLPAPILGVIAAITGLTGAALTLGGGFLLLLPRIAETKRALDAFKASQYAARFTSIGTSLKGMIPSFSGATKGAGSFRTALMGIARAHPVLAGITAAAAVAGIAYKTNFMGIRDAIGGAIDTAKGLGSAFMDAFRETGASAQAARDDIADVAEATKVVDGVTVYTAFKTNADGTREEIGDIIESVANADGKTAQVLIDAEDGPYWATIDLATGEISNAEIEVTAEAGQTFTIFERINAGLEAMKGAAQSAGLGFAVPIISGLQQIVGMVGTAWGVIGPFVDRFKAQFQSLNMIFNPLSAGLIAMTRAMSTIDFGPLQGAADALMGVFENLGYGIQRIGEGAREVISAIASAWQGQFGAALAHARNALDLFGEGFGRLGQAASAAGDFMQAATGLIADGLSNLAGRFPIVSDSLNALSRAFRQAGKVWQGIFSAVAKLLQGDLGGAFDALGDVVNDFGDLLGDVFEAGFEIIADLADMIDSGLSWAFDSLRNKFSAFSSTFDRLQGVLSGVVGVVKNLAEAFADLLRGDVSGFFSNLGEAALDALEAVGNAMLTLPTLIIEAIRAIDWGAVGSALMEGFRSAWEWLQDVSTWVLEGLQGVADALSSWWQETTSSIDWGGVLSSAWDTLTSVASSIVDKLGDIGSALWDWFTSAVTGVDWMGILAGAWNVLTGVVSWILEKIGQAATLTAELFSWAWSALQGVDWGAIISNVWSALKNVGSWILEQIGNAATLTANLFSWAWEAISGVDWMAVIGALWTALKNVGSWIMDQIGNAATLTARLFSWAWEALQGVDWGAIFQLAIDVLKNAGQWIVDKVQSGAEAAYNGIKSWAEGIWQGVVDALEPVISTAVTIINRMIDALNMIPGVDIEPISMDIKGVGDAADAAADQVGGMADALDRMRKNQRDRQWAEDPGAGAPDGEPTAYPLPEASGFKGLETAIRNVGLAAKQTDTDVGGVRARLAEVMAQGPQLTGFQTVATTSFTGVGTASKTHLAPIPTTVGQMVAGILTNAVPGMNNLLSSGRAAFSGLQLSATTETGTMQRNVVSNVSTMQKSAVAEAGSMERGIRSHAQTMKKDATSESSTMNKNVAAESLGMRVALLMQTALMQATSALHFTTMTSNARTAATNVRTTMESGMRDASRAVSNAAGEWPRLISSAAGAMSSAGRSVGAAAGEGVAAGLRGALGSVRAAANAIVAEVDRAMRKAAEVRSPSRMTRRIAEFMGEGVVEGLLAMIRDIARAARSVAEAATPNIGAVTPGMDATALARAAGTFGGLATAGAGVVVTNNLYVSQQPGESGEAFAERAIELITTGYMDGGAL